MGGSWRSKPVFPVDDVAGFTQCYENIAKVQMVQQQMLLYGLAQDARIDIARILRFFDDEFVDSLLDESGNVAVLQRLSVVQSCSGAR
jgi:hypothetical protein